MDRTPPGPRLLLLIALLLASWPPRAIAGQSIADAVGYVESRSGESRLTRAATGVSAPVRAGVELYPGDRLALGDPHGRIVIQLNGRHGPILIDLGRTPFVVPSATPPSQWGRALDFIRSLGDQLSMKDRTARSTTYADRGGGAAGGARGPATPLSAVPALKASIAFAARDLPVLAAGWCGDADLVETYMAAQAEPLTSSAVAGRAHVAIEGLDQLSAAYGAGGPDRLRISPARPSREPPLDYRLRWISLADAPRPDWLAPGQPLSPEDRVAWGAWLLRKAPPGYGLVAMSLLHAERSQVALSGYLLDAETSCSAG